MVPQRRRRGTVEGLHSDAKLHGFVDAFGQVPFSGLKADSTFEGHGYLHGPGQASNVETTTALALSVAKRSIWIRRDPCAKSHGSTPSTTAGAAAVAVPTITRLPERLQPREPRGRGNCASGSSWDRTRCLVGLHNLPGTAALFIAGSYKLESECRALILPFTMESKPCSTCATFLMAREP